MKIRSEGADLEIEFGIVSDGRHCDEYVLLGRPVSNNDENPLKECYVAIDENTHVAVMGYMSGTVRQARFDLIVDGSWVGDRLVEAPVDGGTKIHKRRRLEFKTVTSMLDGQGDLQTTKIVDGELTALPLPDTLDPRILVGNGETFGVGSIVIIASIEQYPTSGHLPNPNEYPDRILGSWVTRQLEPRDPGILPTHAMEMRNANDNIIKQKGNKMQYRFEAPKFGYKPFAKLIFNYRSREALRAAGVIPAPHRTYKVEAERGARLVISSPDHQGADAAGEGLSSTDHHDRPSDCAAEAGSLLTWNELVLLYEQERVDRQRAGLLPSSLRCCAASSDTVVVKDEPDDIGVLIQVAGQDHSLPPLQVILDLIPQHGIILHRLLQILLPEMPGQDLSEAARLLLHYLKDVAALRYDQHGQQLVIKRQYLSELKRQSIRIAAQQAQQGELVSPEISHARKRMRYGDHLSDSQEAGRDSLTVFRGGNDEEVIIKTEPGIHDGH